MKLLLTGFIQVLLVTANTVMIARGNYYGVLCVGFLISFVWTWNVKRVVFGGMSDRLLYSAGAALGGLCGLFIGQVLIG